MTSLVNERELARPRYERDQEPAELSKATASAAPDAPTPSSSPVLLYGAAGIVLLLVLQTQGLLGLILQTILVVLGAIVLHTIPAAKSVLEAITGSAPTPLERLSLLDARPAGERNAEKQVARPDDTGSQYVALNVGSKLRDPFDKLLSLVVRDFVAWWYLASISLGDDRFLKHVRSAFNVFFNNATRTVRQKNPAELATYLISSISTTLVIELRDSKERDRQKAAGTLEDLLDQQAEDKRIEERDRLRRLRSSCEELMLTFFPRRDTTSPIVASLLTETMTCQATKTISGLDSDWINRTIISYLEAPDPASLPPNDRESGSVLAPEAAASALHAVIDQGAAAGGTAASALTSLAGLPVTLANELLPGVAKLPNDPREIAASISNADPEARADIVLQLKAYLLEHEAEQAQLAMTGRAADPESAKLKALLDDDDDPSSDAFHEYMEARGPRAEGLVRLYAQLSSFKNVVLETSPDAQTLEQDILSISRKVLDSLDALLERSEDTEWRRRLLDTAVRQILLNVAESPTAEVFAPLQNWAFAESRTHFVNFYRTVSTPEPNFFAASTVPTALRRDHQDLIERSFQNSPSFSDDPDLGARMPDDAPDSNEPADGGASGSTPRQQSPPSAASPPYDLPARPPQVSVSVTDVSPPSAFDDQQRVRRKNELEFVIAVESDGNPGYIIARSYSEIERLDAQLAKLLPNAGTVDFPRALLPSTTFKTSEAVSAGLEAYVYRLLTDGRYATTVPVLNFFQKDRAGSKNDNNPINNIWDIGRGAGKGIVKGGDLATKGLMSGLTSVTGTVTGVFDRKSPSDVGPSSQSQPPPTSSDATSPQAPRRFGSVDFKPNFLRRQGSSASGVSQQAGPSAVASGSQSDLPSTSPPEPKSSTSAGVAPQLSTTLENEPIFPSGGYDVPESPSKPAEFKRATLPPTGDDDDALAGVSSTSSAQFDELRSSQTGGAQAKAVLRRSSGEQASQVEPAASPPPSQLGMWADQQPKSSAPPPPSSRQATSDTGTSNHPASRSKPTKPTSAIHEDPKVKPKPTSPTSQSLPSQPVQNDAARRPSSGVPTSTPDMAVNPHQRRQPLTQREFESIFQCGISVLETAYALDSSWNIKRGILRMIEQVIRSGYSSTVRLALERMIDAASNEDMIAETLNGMRESFWPDGQWWKPDPNDPQRTAADKERDRLKARALMQAQAPDGLKIALGANATADAFGRLHDVLQNSKVMAVIIMDMMRLLIL